MHHDSHSDQLQILRVPQWAGEDWLLHGFSTRAGGVSRIAAFCQSPAELKQSIQWNQLNLGYTAHDDPEAVAENRMRFLGAVEELRASSQPDSGGRWGGGRCGLVTLKQMHSNLARRVGRAEVGERASLWGDALLTDELGVLLGIQTADCLPILIVDRKGDGKGDRERRAVAAAHAGWRGTLKGIVGRTVEAMRREFGSRPETLTAAIGPGIGSCCFQVGTEVRDLFAARFSYASELFSSGPILRLDLAEANRRQLAEAGVPSEAIFHLGDCTNCHPERFFSYRAERGRTGRMMAVVGIKPD